MFVTSAEDKPPGTNNTAPTHIKHFVEHFLTITWLTYRKNFPPIEGTQITTDCGWGCMVRSGQMMLATALNYHLLGKGMYWVCSWCNSLRSYCFLVLLGLLEACLAR